MSRQAVKPVAMALVGAHGERRRGGTGEGSRRVSWIEGAAPEGEEAQLVFEAVAGRGLTKFGDIVKYLADTLYLRDFLRGGWATDIGLLRPLYRREARELLERLEGRLVRIS